MSKFDKVIDLLKKTKVEVIAPHKTDIHTVKSTNSVGHTLRLLMKHKILSAPVLDEKGKPLGYIDVLDLLSFCVDTFKEVGTEQNIYKRLESGTKFKNAKITDIKDFTKQKVFNVKKGTSCYDLLDFFVKKSAHRCFIVDENGDPQSIITQSNVLKLIGNNKDCFMDSCGKFLVKELPKMGTAPVYCVSKNTKTFTAFMEMSKKGFSGVGIVDNAQRLIGNVSARDLEMIPEEHFYTTMVMGIGKFLQMMKMNEIDEKAPVISVRVETSLSYIIQRLVGNRIHRIYVVDKELKPLRIISLRDVLGLFTK